MFKHHPLKKLLTFVQTQYINAQIHICIYNITQMHLLKYAEITRIKGILSLEEMLLKKYSTDN